MPEKIIIICLEILALFVQITKQYENSTKSKDVKLPGEFT